MTPSDIEAGCAVVAAASLVGGGILGLGRWQGKITSAIEKLTDIAGKHDQRLDELEDERRRARR